MKKIIFILFAACLIILPIGAIFAAMDCSPYGPQSYYDETAAICKCESGYTVGENVSGGPYCVEAENYCDENYNTPSYWDASAEQCKCPSDHVWIKDMDGDDICVTGTEYCSDTYGGHAQYSAITGRCECESGYIFPEHGTEVGSCIAKQHDCENIHGLNAVYNPATELCNCAEGYYLDYDSKGVYGCLRAGEDVAVRQQGADGGVVDAEDSLATVIDQSLVNRLKGHILLQVEEHGEAWYVDPVSELKYYLENGEVAYDALRKFGLGILTADLNKIPVGIEERFEDVDTDEDGLADKLEEGLKTDVNNSDTDEDGISDYDEVITMNTNPLGTGSLVYDNSLIKRLSGRILIQVESRGEAWYLNPQDNKRYYMKDGPAAYQIMRFLSLGILNTDLRKIGVGRLSDL